MAQDFHDAHEISKKTFEEAAEACGEDLAAICFADEDPRLNLTEFTQPCILTAEIAMYRVLTEQHGFAPVLFAGHSLGEYTALVAAGAMPFADAVRIVRKRGALMQAAVPEGVGAMAAAIFPDIENTKARDIIKDSGAELANLNSSNQLVLSGKKEPVHAAVKALQDEFGVYDEDTEEGIDMRILEVSAPFHSSLMKEIEPEFREYLGQFQAGFAPEKAAAVISNFTGALHEPGALVDNLVNQISGAVRWTDNMRVIAEGAQKIYEVGPNRPLGRFLQTIGRDATSIINLRSLKKAFK